MGNQFCQSFALLPGGTEPWIWISKPSESRIKKFISGRSLPAAALSVKGPSKNKFRRTIMVSSHPSKPMVNQRGLPDPGPGNDRKDIFILVFPCPIPENDLPLSTKNIASSNGQSGD